MFDPTSGPLPARVTAVRQRLEENSCVICVLVAQVVCIQPVADLLDKSSQLHLGFSLV